MKNAIVTGGAGLIGTGICEALVARGFDVASFDLTVSTHPSDGVRGIECDVADEASVDIAIAELGWDQIDLLVNNAGATAGALGTSILDMSFADWRRVIDSHLTGAFLMTRAVVPLMRTGGSIVNMASTRAFMSEPNSEAYAASKGGLVALTHALAVSLGPKIRVNAVAPGWITNDMDLSEEDEAQHPVGRVGRPKDIADAVLYLDGAGFVTGQVLTVDGGMTKKMIYTE
ncbi:SDR family NAD(P)-dependent oxidoreductase [Aliirhizobium smilacinae]|uniref:SDR family oxidoreductase n=1 Tax=Aliirhizobium smilacinae TaxID=1395944 RepID=A0A5C4XGW1_9HYPH|nr:SDR family oxidoreductase [Rhizobium smilacinae]TNM62637.1 SDR family oxidoreductase [Rhizobium smilacinae]